MMYVGDGESVGDLDVVILGEAGVVFEEVYRWNRISIDLTHQQDTPPIHGMWLLKKILTNHDCVYITVQRFTHTITPRN